MFLLKGTRYLKLKVKSPLFDIAFHACTLTLTCCESQLQKLFLSRASISMSFEANCWNKTNFASRQVESTKSFVRGFLAQFCMNWINCNDFVMM